jgi:hypothetical protein
MKKEAYLYSCAKITLKKENFPDPTRFDALPAKASLPNSAPTVKIGGELLTKHEMIQKKVDELQAEYDKLQALVKERDQLLDTKKKEYAEVEAKLDTEYKEKERESQEQVNLAQQQLASLAQEAKEESDKLKSQIRLLNSNRDALSHSHQEQINDLKRNNSKHLEQMTKDLKQSEEASRQSMAKVEIWLVKNGFALDKVLKKGKQLLGLEAGKNPVGRPKKETAPKEVKPSQRIRRASKQTSKIPQTVHDDLAKLNMVATDLR